MSAMLDVTGLTARPRELTPVLGNSQASPPSRLRPLPRPTPSSTQRFGSSFIVHIPPFGAVGRPLQEPVRTASRYATVLERARNFHRIDVTSFCLM